MANASQDRQSPILWSNTFWLRGRQLTINYSHTTKKITVSMQTRAIMYNAPKTAANGNTYSFVIELKDCGRVLATLLYSKKHERNSEFRRLQSVLNHVR